MEAASKQGGALRPPPPWEPPTNARSPSPPLLQPPQKRGGRVSWDCGTRLRKYRGNKDTPLISFSNSQRSLNSRLLQSEGRAAEKPRSLPPTGLPGEAECQKLPPEDPQCPEASLKWSSHQGVKTAPASGFAEPHPTPQRREEVAENQGLCESLRIRGMSHFPGGGGWRLGGEGQSKLIEEKAQLREERGTQATFPVPGALSPPRRDDNTRCFLSVRFYQKSVFPAPGTG